MITIIYGAKGTGKTKAIIDKANEAVVNAKGAIVYVTDTKDHMYQLKHEIRYVMTKEYQITNLDSFIGFLNGMIAVDHDIQYLFIDGAARISNVHVIELKNLFNVLEKNDGINFILTISSDYANIPDFIKKHIN